MTKIEYLRFENINLTELMDVLNEDSLRTHLVGHPYFNSSSIQAWIEEKLEIDARPGCRIRVVSIGGELAGWCGIQPDDDGFEIAIVISKRFWGAGIPIFKTLMSWAKELGHEEVLLHLLDSRREYKGLAKKAVKVQRTQLLNRSFTTYYFSVV